jgi:hypothetical protein
MPLQVRGVRENHLRGIHAQLDGRTLVTGVSGSRNTSPWWCAPFALHALVVNNITLLGSLGSPGVWDETIHLLEAGIIRIAPLITHRRPLSSRRPAIDHGRAPRRAGQGHAGGIGRKGGSHRPRTRPAVQTAHRGDRESTAIFTGI